MKTSDVVIVDEAHHAPARGFRNVLSELRPKMLVGMTATPFRDDGLNLEDVFGSKVAQVSLIEGMNRGYLAQVDYNVYCDNIDWKEVGRATKGKMSIRDLNKRLFLPQRDEAIVSEIIKMMDKVADPRVIIFSSSIEHGERFARLLEVNGLSCQPLSGKPRAERYDGLMKFLRGSLRAITAVDVLNEGIDVPEVNVVVFLRCTHSRRIFLQQLGRGLRISENKDRVMVMDFVADIRRLADMAELEREVRNASRERKDVIINSADIRFSNDNALPFMEAWMREDGDIGGLNENVKLNFPVFET